MEELAKLKAAALKKTTTLDAEALKKSTEKASEMQKEATLTKPVPKTATGFE